ncbi:COP23 domain-containing protein [Leptothoe sp. EHU-05/26/07-4]
MKTFFLVSATLISSFHVSTSFAEAFSVEVNAQQNSSLFTDKALSESKYSTPNSVEIQPEVSVLPTKPALSEAKSTAPKFVNGTKALGIPSENVVGPSPGADLPTTISDDTDGSLQVGVGPSPGNVLSLPVEDSDADSSTTNPVVDDLQPKEDTSQQAPIAFRPGVNTELLSINSDEDTVTPADVGPSPGDTSVIAQAENNDASSDVSETSPTTPVANLPSENVSQPILDRASVTGLPTSTAASLTSSQPTLIPENFQANPVEEITLLDLEKLAYKLELEDVDFLCQTKNGSPATIAKLKDEDELLVVLWDSDFFADSGYDSETRCDQVSARFEEFFQEDLLVYITNGELNNQPVICVTDNENGDCGEGIPLHKGLLFTLKPNEDSKEKLDQLVSILKLPEVPEEQKPLKE